MPSTRRRKGRHVPPKKRLYQVAAIVALLLLALPAAAEFYRYTDADGQVHYVDDPRHIPDSQLDTLKVYPDVGRGEDAREANAAADDGRPEEDAAAAVGGDRDSGASPSTAILETPVVVRGHRVLVPVEISYRGRKITTHLLFDTGASMTILHQQVARQVLLTGTETREAVVVGGSRIPIRLAELDYIQIGPYKVPNAQVAIIRHQGRDPGHQGLLGMNILRHLDYALDVDRGVIVWNR
jgi:hypothetical protein